MCACTRARRRRFAAKRTHVEEAAEPSVCPNLFRNAEGPRDLAARSVGICEFAAALVVLRGARGLVQSACSPVAATTYSLPFRGGYRGRGNPCGADEAVVLSGIASSPLVCARALVRSVLLGAFFFLFFFLISWRCLRRTWAVGRFCWCSACSCVHSSVADSRRVGLSN